VGAGKLLIIAGAVLMAAGLVVSLGPKMPFGLGKLPGDIQVSGKNGTFYFPVVTCLIISLILSLIGSLFTRR
jgi:hypothetical protein